MTREEAIKKLQKQKAEYLEEWVDYSGVVEAYDLAIEALSAEPKGDLISRADTRKAFVKINDLRTLSLGKVGEVLDSVPSAEAVQGEWEHLSIKSISRSGVDELQELQCSNCGKWVTTPYMYYPSYHKFCPNCGARMKEGAE